MMEKIENNKKDHLIDFITDDLSLSEQNFILKPLKHEDDSDYIERLIIKVNKMSEIKIISILKKLGYDKEDLF